MIALTMEVMLVRSKMPELDMSNLRNNANILAFRSTMFLPVRPPDRMGESDSGREGCIWGGSNGNVVCDQRGPGD